MWRLGSRHARTERYGLIVLASIRTVALALNLNGRFSQRHRVIAFGHAPEIGAESNVASSRGSAASVTRRVSPGLRSSLLPADQPGDSAGGVA